MTMQFETYPPPPADFVAAYTPQIVSIAVIGLVVAFYLIAALKELFTTGSPITLMLIIGGALTSVFEPIAAVLYHIYYGEDVLVAYTVLGRDVPIWIVVSWTSFCGVGSVCILQQMRKPDGLDRASLWKIIGLIAVVDVMIEVPLIQLGVYLYYGPQPFVFMGLPMLWTVLNIGGPLLTAAIIHRGEAWFTGPRAFIAVVVPPMSTGVMQGAALFPLLVGLNSGWSLLAIHVAAIVSLALTLLLYYALSLVACSNARTVNASAVLET